MSRTPHRVLSIHQPVRRLGVVLHWRTDVFHTPRPVIISQLLLGGDVVVSRSRSLALAPALLREQLFQHHREVLDELASGGLDPAIRDVLQVNPRAALSAAG